MEILSIAENRLIVDLIKEKSQRQHYFPDSVFFYDNMTGSDRLKAAMLTLVHSAGHLHNNRFTNNCLYAQFTVQTCSNRHGAPLM